MSVTGHMDGEPGAGPMKVGPSIVDYMTGMNEFDRHSRGTL